MAWLRHPWPLALVCIAIVPSCGTSLSPLCTRPDAIELGDGSRDETCESFEETVPVALLQVSTQLGRTSEEVSGHILPASSPMIRQSLTMSILEQAEHNFVPIFTSILLPHAFAFCVAQFLLRRHRGKKAEFLKEAANEDNSPRSFSYIISRVAPMWAIHALSIFAYGAAAPSLDYMYLNAFSQRYSSGQRLDCSSQMESAACSRAVADVMQLKIAKGFAHPVIQFCAGPALGAISDAFGRRPSVLCIRVALLLPTVAAAAVAWFDLSIWLEFAVQFIGMVPTDPIPIAWYMDRIDHTPSLVMATSMVESSCILASILGSLLGSTLSLKNAMLLGMLGKVICLFLAVFCLPESLPEEKRVRFTWSSLLPTAALRVIFQSPLVEKLTALGIFDSFHYTGFYVLFSQFLQQRLAWSRHDTYVNGMLEHVSQMLWLTVGIVVLWPRLGQVGIIAACTIAAGISNVLLMLSSAKWQVNLNSLLLRGVLSMANCVIIGICGKAASPAKQGMLQSGMALVIQVSTALGPPAFLTVYELCDPTAPGAAPWRMAVYVVYGLLFAIPSLMLTFALRRFIGEDSDSADT